MFLESDCPSLFVEMLRNFIALDRWDPEPAVGDSWLGTVREPQCHSGQTLPAENTGVHRGPPALTARGTRGSPWKFSQRCWTDNPNWIPLLFCYSVRQL